MLNSKLFNYYSSIVGASSLFSLQSSAINWDFENLGESLRTCQVSGGGDFQKEWNSVYEGLAIYI